MLYAWCWYGAALATTTCLPSGLSARSRMLPPSTEACAVRVAVPEATSYTASSAGLCVSMPAASVPGAPGADARVGAENQVRSWSWSRVTTGSAPDRSSDPMLPSPAAPYPNQSLPPASAGCFGSVPSPVAYRADSLSPAVSMVTIASAPGTAAYNVPESAESSRPVTPGREVMVPTTAPL